MTVWGRAANHERYLQASTNTSQMLTAKQTKARRAPAAAGQLLWAVVQLQAEQVQGGPESTTKNRARSHVCSSLRKYYGEGQQIMNATYKQAQAHPKCSQPSMEDKAGRAPAAAGQGQREWRC